jgi:6-phosphogluconate dehydrogenase
MQLGMIGLGRMGANMVRRLMRGGHECVVYDLATDAVHGLASEGAQGATTLQQFVTQLARPRTVWLMVPAGAVDSTLDALVPKLDTGDVVIDGGNSHYRDSLARAHRLADLGLHFVDCGTSGGILGLDRGYCVMIGGEMEIVQRLDPVFAALAPGAGSIAVTPGRNGPVPEDGELQVGTPYLRSATADRGYLHCGPHGAGHFVKMVHNGIEYGLMAAYAEGLNILQHANVGKRPQGADAETTPLRDPAAYQYDFDLADITELWRRGSVISSWLLDLTAAALAADPTLDGFAGRVSDSGEGRWTLQAAIEEGVPANVLATALFGRFASRGGADFQNRVLSAMRAGFGGHQEKGAGA